MVCIHSHNLIALVAQMVKRLPAMQETWVQSPVQEDPLEREMATHSSTLAWKILWIEEPGRPQSMGLQKVGHYWATSLVHAKVNSLGSLRRVCYCSVTWLCSTLCDPMGYSTPAFPVPYYLLEFAQIHVHGVGDTIRPSHSMWLSSPALNLSQHQGLFKWVGSLHQMA